MSCRIPARGQMAGVDGRRGLAALAPRRQRGFYLSPDNKVMAAEVKACGSSFEIGTVRALFETRPYRTGGAAFDVTGDGQRFIVDYVGEQPTAAITLVVNWTADLKK